MAQVKFIEKLNRVKIDMELQVTDISVTDVKTGIIYASLKDKNGELILSADLNMVYDRILEYVSREIIKARNETIKKMSSL